MKTKKIILSIGLLCGLTSISAHDDLIYRTQTQWHFDLGNKAQIARTSDAGFKGASFAGDYNGDGLVDLCEVDTSGPYIEWTWKINNGNGDWIVNPPVYFGISATDKCVVGDFNGDGKTDIALLRSGSGVLATWYIDFSPCEGNFETKGNFGLPEDIPLAGDFNGDGIDDLCVYRPSTGQWYVAFSSLTGFPEYDMPLAINGVWFGSPGDVPFTGDFNGDGYTDMALYRPSVNQVLVNCWSAAKSRFEHFAASNGAGSVDLTINVPVSEVLAVMAADVDNSRPRVLPAATSAETGSEVNLRHGWTCIFDNSLDVDKWAQNLKAAGINTLEYHPWMRAHEEIAPQTQTWNTYVGDDRLWTSKAMMKKKIEKFRTIGGRSVCYTGIYAATPAFAQDHPDWAMRNANDRNFITYGNSYLYLMATNESVNAPYTVNGESYKNFNDYFVAQAVKAQEEYNWDGYRWDWYGLPEQYVCNGTTETGNFSTEMAPLVNRLDLAVKEKRADCTTTALQLPSTSGNVPHYTTGAVANHQFMELWPFGTGTKYSDLYRDIYEAKSRYPDKPVFANFYPPAEMNLSSSWPKQNISYQFATCLSAGGYPAAQVVDGVAGFTDPVPFHAVNYPQDILDLIAKWNKFTEAYGAYLYYSNRAYVFSEWMNSDLSVEGAPESIVAKLKIRWDKRTRQHDALIVDVINYGAKELRWDAINAEPQAQSVNLQFTLPAGFVAQDLYCVTLNGREKVNYTLDGGKVNVSVPSFATFATLVLLSDKVSEMPAEPQPVSEPFSIFAFGYDAAGKTLRAPETTTVVALDEHQPLVVSNDFNGNVSTVIPTGDAFAGETAWQVTPGMVRYTTTADGAIRIPVDEFNKFNISIRSNNATACWFGFRLIKPSETSPVWETRDLFYRVGYPQQGLGFLTLTPNKPKDGEWVEYSRDIMEDIKGYWGEGWTKAIVTAVFLGPVDCNSADYDHLVFTAGDQSGVENTKKKDDKVSVRFDPEGNLQIQSELISQNDLYEVRISDTGGKICYQKALAVEEGRLFCQDINLSRGAYVLSVLNGNRDRSLVYSGVIIR